MSSVLDYSGKVSSQHKKTRKAKQSTSAQGMVSGTKSKKSKQIAVANMTQLGPSMVGQSNALVVQPMPRAQSQNKRKSGMALLLPPQSANVSMVAGATTAGRYTKADRSQDADEMLHFMPGDLRTLSFEQM